MRLGFDPKDGGNGPTYIRNSGRMYGQMHGCKDGWTDSPCVLQDYVPFRAVAQIIKENLKNLKIKNLNSKIKD